MELYHDSFDSATLESNAADAVPPPPCGGGADASLGTTRKSLNPPPLPYVQKQYKRLERWALQSASREILGTKAMNSCCRAPIPQRNSVDIWQSHDHYHYGGLMVCGSVWACPVCAGKISERRKVEVSTALDKHTASGGSAQLWTFTAPHHLGQSLDFLGNAMNQARGKMLNRRPWKRLMASLGVQGTIRGVEVTFSFVNGWHVHFHVLAFLPGGAFDLHEIEGAMYTQWRSACIDSGLGEPTRAHGVSVENGDKAAAYVGKWGLEHEITKSHIKEGREGHLTPFDFLREYLSGDLRYGALFKEYFQFFKGKRQLVWSDGLRDRLGLDRELTDEEIAERHDQDAVLFAQIPLSAWRSVLKQNRRGELLEKCRLGEEAFFDYLFELMEKSGDLEVHYG